MLIISLDQLYPLFKEANWNRKKLIIKTAISDTGWLDVGETAKPVEVPEADIEENPLRLVIASPMHQVIVVLDFDHTEQKKNAINIAVRAGATEAV